MSRARAIQWRSGHIETHAPKPVYIVAHVDNLWMKGHTMIITQDGEQTVIDGEGLWTFIKPGQPSGVPIKGKRMAVLGEAIALEYDEVSQHTITNFAFERLTGNPFKDCWRLLRWYFSRKEVR